ncbi:MAG: hypothetical protein E7356_01385 [Clostridiales bacterium]|nr:hypothetical protein [Clostridiales bacterium]
MVRAEIRYRDILPVGKTGRKSSEIYFEATQKSEGAIMPLNRLSSYLAYKDKHILDAKRTCVEDDTISNQNKTVHVAQEISKIEKETSPFKRIFNGRVRKRLQELEQMRGKLIGQGSKMYWEARALEEDKYPTTVEKTAIYREMLDKLDFVLLGSEHDDRGMHKEYYASTLTGDELIARVEQMYIEALANSRVAVDEFRLKYGYLPEPDVME